MTVRPLFGRFLPLHIHEIDPFLIPSHNYVEIFIPSYFIALKELQNRGQSFEFSECLSVVLIPCTELTEINISGMIPSIVVLEIWINPSKSSEIKKRLSRMVCLTFK